MERITSRKNPLCVHIKKLGASKSYRATAGEFLCDGLKLLNEAVNNKAVIKTVITCSDLPFPLPPETRVCFTTRSVIDSLSPLKNSQDTLFVCQMKDITSGNKTSSGNSILLLDGLQDPGNVGTIIRTADALGISEIMLCENCADLFNPKTIRATMGAIFRQKVTVVSINEIKTLVAKGVRILGATVGENCSEISRIDLSDSIIAIGSEGNGLSEAMLSLCEEFITIPISPECDSLNAAMAASIIMWELVRCRL